MNKARIMEALMVAITDECGDAPTALDRECTAADVPGWDSLAHMRIMMNLEARLAIEIDIDRSYRARTIGELVDLVLAASC